MKIFAKINQLFCSHVCETKTLIEGQKEYIELPKYEYGLFRNYYIDVVEEKCLKCGNCKIKYKRRYVSCW